MLVVCNRDHKGVGVAHKTTLPKNQLSDDIGKIKHKNFQTDLKCCQKVATDKKKLDCNI